MQLLRDNLLLWTSEMADDDAAGAQKWKPNIWNNYFITLQLYGPLSLTYIHTKRQNQIS